MVDVSKSYFRKEKKKRNLLEEIECSTMTPSEFASMVDDSELVSKGLSVRATRKKKGGVSGMEFEQPHSW